MIELTKEEQGLLSIIQKISDSQKNAFNLHPSKGLKGCYPYINITMHGFYKELKALNKIEVLRSKEFVDYGSGIGMTMAIANYCFGMIAVGYEYNKKLIDKCKEFFYYRTYKANLITQILAQDSYDVVYFFCPMYDRNKELKFEKKAIKSVRIGGYLIAPGPSIVHEGYNNFYGFNKSLECYLKNFEKVKGLGFTWRRIK